MTAQVDPGQKLQATDEAKLMDVYLRLEQYLTTQEPIRSFTKEELRARIAPDLLQRLAAHENKR